MEPMVRRFEVQVKIPVDLFVAGLQSLRIFSIWLDTDFFATGDAGGRGGIGKDPAPYAGQESSAQADGFANWIDLQRQTMQIRFNLGEQAVLQ